MDHSIQKGNLQNIIQNIENKKNSLLLISSKKFENFYRNN